MNSKDYRKELERVVKELPESFRTFAKISGDELAAMKDDPFYDDKDIVKIANDNAAEIMVKNHPEKCEKLIAFLANETQSRYEQCSKLRQELNSVYFLYQIEAEARSKELEDTEDGEQ